MNQEINNTHTQMALDRDPKAAVPYGPGQPRTNLQNWKVGEVETFARCHNE